MTSYLEIVPDEPGNPDGPTLIFNKFTVESHEAPTSSDATNLRDEIADKCAVCAAACGGVNIVRWIFNDAVIALGQTENAFEQGGDAICITSKEPPYMALPHIGDFDAR